MRSFPEKDFAAINNMSLDAKQRINRCAAKAVRRLKLTPSRKEHSMKFSREQANVSHTTSMRDIEAFINSVVEPMLPPSSGNRRQDRIARRALAAQFEDACNKVCRLFVLTLVK